MTPEQYLQGWRERGTWKNNYNERHTVRFSWLAANVVGQDFADVGCALGHSTNILNGLHPGAWTGIEFNEAAVEEARANFPALSFLCVDTLADLPAVGTFDTVVCSEVIEHVEDPTLLVKNLVAIANRRILLTTPNIIVGDPGHVRLYSDKSLAALLDGLDYSISKAGVFYQVAVEVQ